MGGRGVELGAKFEHRRHEDRGAKGMGCGEGFPSPWRGT